MRKFVIAAGAVILLAIVFIAMANSRSDGSPTGVFIGRGDFRFEETSYAAYLAYHGWDGTFAGAEVHVDLSTGIPGGGISVGATDTGVETAAQGSVTFTFNVPTAGFYNLFVEYLPLPGTFATIERRILINDEIPFAGLQQILFNRSFDNTSGQPIALRGGNEVRPQSSEVFEWTGMYVADSLRRNLSPYRIYLPAGQNTITFVSVREPMKIGQIIFREASRPLPFHATSRNPALFYTGAPITGNAERIYGATTAVYKSVRTIINQVDFVNPDTLPHHPYRFRFNTIGGSSWQSPGETIGWDIYVPQAGYYGITFRARQHLNRGVMSFRRLWVNGEVPFAEAERLGFPFSNTFVQYGIYQDGETLPIWLEAGHNRIALENVLGDLAGPLAEVEYILRMLTNLYVRVVQITGETPDRFIDYQIDIRVPDFVDSFSYISDRLFAIQHEVEAIAGGDQSTNASLLEMMARQARRMADNPHDIASEIATLNANISSVAEWVISISEMPLELSSITLHAPAAPYNPPRAGLGARAWNGLVRFFATFVVNESDLDDGGVPRDAITVWISTGRDPATILQGQIAGEFVPATDIPVNLQLIPADVVLPAVLAGVGPDVVLGMGQASVINFAMRNALVDLSEMPGWDEFSQRFFPSALDTVRYLGGIYGAPEQQWFPMMYLRNDILDPLGIEAPRTWDEFRDAIVILNQHQFDVFMPITTTTDLSIFGSLLFQHGGELFLGEGDDFGIASALYSPQAMYAFHKYTSFFTNFSLPIQVNFQNRFRTGEMPIGIDSYTFFNTLEVFAPEIRGLWSFAPIPGVLQEDGSINNAALTAVNHTIMLRSDDPDVTANSWEFIQWWLSADVQTDFANQLEGILGSAGRYATAQADVLQRLPWAPHIADELLNQFENTIGIPEVPGGYMAPRMVDFAFRSVVTDNNAMTPRQALHMNIFEIDRELTRRREEFGLSTIYTHPQYANLHLLGE